MLSLVAALRADEELAQQARANNKDHFLASPTLKDAITLAIVETNMAHGRMAELFHQRGGVEVAVVEALGQLLYLELVGASAS